MKLATLFSGIGAPEIAALRVFKKPTAVFACEIDKFARKSYEAIHGKKPDYEDVHNVKGALYRGEITLLAGGSPCQSFSLAGLRKGLDDDRGQLIYQFYRIVDEARPKIFLFENVKGFRTIDKGETMRQFEESFRRIGYTVKSTVLNTKDYGLPQNRERYFLVGFLSRSAGECFKFPDPITLDKTLGDIIEENVDEKYYLSERALTGFIAHDERHRGKGSGFRFKPKIIRRYRQYTEGAQSRWTNRCIYYPAPERIQQRSSASNTICPTLTRCPWQNNNRLKGIRKLTPKECWRLQGFPDWAHDASEDAGVSDTQRYKQAGNTMSVNVIEAIFREIKKARKK